MQASDAFLTEALEHLREAHRRFAALGGVPFFGTSIGGSCDRRLLVLEETVVAGGSLVGDVDPMPGLDNTLPVLQAQRLVEQWGHPDLGSAWGDFAKVQALQMKRCGDLAEEHMRC